MDQRLKLYRQIALARNNLLAMTVLTIINIAAYFFGGNFGFPFSAFFPYAAIVFGDIFAVELADPMIFYWGAGFSVIALTLFLVGYFLSKKRHGWLIVVTILYGLDLLFMTYIYFPDFDFSALLDYVFHFWVLYYLVIGVSATMKLKKLSMDVESDPFSVVEKPL
ncbi:MAG: hypothetical protein CVU85_01045 [Firmicutes bacterium HGW-Firmicutes-10]|nr:MAG: hypothetical protein CVU85_01045 [Firmicutes bacterium HGW-Firmicutes-10]